MSFKKVLFLAIGVILLFAAYPFIKNAYSLYKARNFVVIFINTYQEDKLLIKSFLSDELLERFPDDPNTAIESLESNFPHGFKGAEVSSVRKLADGLYDAILQLNDEYSIMLQFREVGDSYRINYISQPHRE